MSKTALWTAIVLACAVDGRGAQAQTPIPPSPRDFVLAASQSDRYEILAAHVAKVQGRDPRVQAFATDMIRDHTRLTEDLRQAALASGLQAPDAGLSSDEAALLSGLQSLRGVEFDKTYARQQVVAHTRAAAVEESFGDAGADPNLRRVAQAALPTIRKHLRDAQQLRAALDGG